MKPQLALSMLVVAVTVVVLTFVGQWSPGARDALPAIAISLGVTAAIGIALARAASPAGRWNSRGIAALTLGLAVYFVVFAIWSLASASSFVGALSLIAGAIYLGLTVHWSRRIGG